MKYETLRRIKKKQEQLEKPKLISEFVSLMTSKHPKVIFSQEQTKEIWEELYPDCPIPCKIWILGYENEDYFKLRKLARETDIAREKATIEEHGRLIRIEESSAFNFFIPKIDAHYIMYRLNSAKTLTEQITHELNHVYEMHVLHKKVEFT